MYRSDAGVILGGNAALSCAGASWDAALVRSARMGERCGGCFEYLRIPTKLTFDAPPTPGMLALCLFCLRRQRTAVPHAASSAGLLACRCVGTTSAVVI